MLKKLPSYLGNIYVTQSAGMILTQNNYRGQNSFRIHFWDANGVFWKEKELAVQ